jgi:hypothetical protein
MLDLKKGKTIITILLAFSCIISGIMLGASPAPITYKLQNLHEVDSLLNIQIQDAQIISDQIRTTKISADTVFTRKNYWIEVPSRFSKTMFHINLHNEFNLYGIQTPAKVHFPSKDMDIYLYYNDTVLRKIRLTTNPELDTLQINEEP